MLPKIIVYRTHIEITNYIRWDYPSIEKTFSIYEPNYHKYYDKGKYYDEKNKVLMLPRGLDIDYLERLTNTKAYFDQSTDPIGDIGKVLLKTIPRNDIQHQAINFMLDYNNYTMKSINLNTGVGKTFCAVATLSYFHMRSIVITSSIDWLNQWKEKILEYTNIDESEIYFISGTPSIMKLFHRDISKYKVILSTHDTLKSYGDNNGWDKIKELFQYLEIGIKFYDEAHLNFDNMFMIDCYTNSFFTYYLTATPGRSDYTENNIYNLYFKNIPGIDLYDKSRDAHTSYEAIFYNSNPTSQETLMCRNKYGLDRNKYTNYVIHKQNFEYLLYILINDSLNKNGSSLFYIGTNAAILQIRDWIYEHFPELRNNVGVYTSIIPPEQKKIELNKKIILSTTKSAGACMDINNLVETVNLAEPFKSRILAQQTLGRTRNRDTVYRDVVDQSFYYLRKFYEHKRPIFQKYATECSNIRYTDNTLYDIAKDIMDERSKLEYPFIYD